MQTTFTIAVSNLAAWIDSGPAIAAARAAATGVINLEFANDVKAAAEALMRAVRMTRRAAGDLAAKLRSAGQQTESLLRSLPDEIGTVILAFDDEQSFRVCMKLLEGSGRRVFAEVVSGSEAEMAVQLGTGGLVAKGNEAGGFVGEESTFVLLQRLCRAYPSLPVWALGGIGEHSAAACLGGGAAGVLLDVQVSLTPESSLPPRIRAALGQFEGDESICLGQDLGVLFRTPRRTGVRALESWQKREAELAGQDAEQSRAAWRAELESRIGWSSEDLALWPVGQDACLAAKLTARFHNVAGIVSALRQSAVNHCRIAAARQALGPGSGLAAHNGTKYPILQGPMTRVSDEPRFARAVADGGGLPFLALALLRGPQVKTLLAETAELLGDLSWGVGILGFVPPELRAEQLEAVHEVRPRFAIIAGGRPDQAHSLERAGIHTYLHVPAPSLLRLYLQDGSRSFIFEGRECGGHVGPRSSFVLWETMIDTLLAAVAEGVPAQELRVVFAGGIHDARSAAMTAALAAPLVEAGASIGVLMGTAYLFTEEAVESGAIVEEFQRQAVSCGRTVILESGGGHATRCVDTPFADTFRQHKQQYVRAGKSGSELRDLLEDLNLGRLRIATKGIARSSGAGSQFTHLDSQRQAADGMYMIGQVAALRESICTVEQLHREVSTGCVDLLAALPVSAAEPSVREDGAVPCDIAIVGMSCRLPKSPDVETFWSNLVARAHGLEPIRRDRFDAGLYFSEDATARDSIYSGDGGFLEDIPFDPMRYGIPPAALASIDPLQLLTLVAVDDALADAGYSDRPFSRARASVIFGFSGGLGELGVKYAVRSTLPALAQTPGELMERLPEWTEDSFAGLLPNVAAGRVANRFDFGGLNFTVDAACASSLAAVYVGVRELVSGGSDLVVTGGVDTGQNPFGYLCFSKAKALSPRGRCSAFDQSADGTAISEGISVVVLKRLADAERDGDRVYAVIKGIAGSSDGRGRSMTAPRIEGQMLALRRAYAQAGIDPCTVGLIEAHGTGTVAGDAAELAALTEVFRAAGASERACAIGSVKSMVGHTKAAAGVTGLIKVALALGKRVLPPTLHVVKPNPKLLEARNPFYANAEPRPWVADGMPRRAGVSAFGFGGTNFHAVLEEYEPVAQDASDRPPATAWSHELFLWSAVSLESLCATVEQTRSALERVEGRLADIAAAVCGACWSAGPYRLAIVAGSKEDAIGKMTAALSALRSGGKTITLPDGVYHGSGEPAGTVAFLFPGQGSQHPGMMRDLAVRFSEFAAGLKLADTLATPVHGQRLSDVIYPPAAFDDETRGRQMQALTDTAVAQPALGTVELACVDLLTRWGIRPAMTGGHSYGEYVALHAAGVISREALIRLSAARGEAIRSATGSEPGAMAAISATSEAVAGAIAGFDGVVIANCNAPRQTVIAGPAAAVEAAMRAFEPKGITARKVPVACAFHTPLMRHAADRLAQALSAEEFSRPSVPVYSNTTGMVFPADPAEIRAILTAHLTSSVQFLQQIERMYSDGARIFVEAGPKGVLSSLLRQILGNRPGYIVQLDSSNRDGLSQLLHTAAQLAVLGCPVDTTEVFRGRVRSRIDLRQVPAEAKRPGWMLNPARTWRVGENANPEPRLKLVLPSAVPAALPPTVPQVPIAAAVPADTERVMGQFQQLMKQFLETQTNVMTAFLQGSATVPSVAANAYPEPAAQFPPAVIAPEPEISTATKQTRDAREELLQIVSARTGYPPEMLRMEASMEADLGIDSIKRVEILAEYRKQAPEAEQEGIRHIMDQLTGARTLGELADRLAAAGAKAVPARSAKAEMLRIVSERTGYPAEMLSLDAGIESDLGIDSIKRVEILSQFRMQAPPAEQERIRAVMEKLTSARTLGEILAHLEAGPAGAGTPPTDVGAALLHIVSERTGYPVEMLSLRSGIEADLGIDSIKRVEILSEFRKQLPARRQEAMAGVMDALTSAQTLEAVIETLDRAINVSTAPPDNRAAQLQLIPEERPAATRRSAPQPGRVCIITDDETGRAEALAAELRAAGEKPVLMRHSAETPLRAEGLIVANLTEASAVSAAVEHIQQASGPVGAVYHLLPLRQYPALHSLTMDGWRAQIRADVRSLYLIARAAQRDLIQRAVSGRADLIAVTARDGALGLARPGAGNPAHNGVADFLKCLSLEMDGVVCRVVDTNAEGALEAAHLVDELLCDERSLETGIAQKRRISVRPALCGSGERARPKPLTSSSVVLLTGGARGITAEIARTLAAHAKPVLILAGSTPLSGDDEPAAITGLDDATAIRSALVKTMTNGGPPRPAEVEAACRRILKNREIRSTLNELRRAGARCEYRAVDVRNEEAFGALIDAIYAKHGRLDAVVHGAGIIEDKLLRDKTPESFDRVVGTKADSTFVLLRKLRFESLQSLVLMSSISAVFGNRGQADYAAANGIMNGLAAAAFARYPGRATAIAWGPWDRTGMVSDAIREQFLSRGVQLIDTGDGARIVVEVLEGGFREAPLLVVGDGPWSKDAVPAESLRAAGDSA